jgi:putative intracellular protease/amidase
MKFPTGATNPSNASTSHLAMQSRRGFVGALSGILLTAGLSALVPVRAASRRSPRVLIVSTNVDRVAGNVSGTFLMEIAYPFQYFKDTQIEVDVVTPKGGAAAIYNAPNTADDLLTIQRSGAFVEKTMHTLAAHEIRAKDYIGIFFPGGHGQYFDVALNQKILEATAAIHHQGGVIGSAGHGTACLANVKTLDGNYLIKNKKMTCFPTWAEKEWMDISNFGKALPFDMEEVIRARGADLTLCTRETRSDTNLILVSDDDNRLVTGSFARQSRPVAEHMLRLMRMGRTQLSDS